MESDSLYFVLPAFFTIEALPDALELDETFGRFKLSYTVDDSGGLIFLRQLVIDSAQIPAEDYETFRRFLIEVRKHDQNNVVLVNQN